MKSISFKDEAAKLNVSPETVRQSFEKAVANGKVLGIFDKKNEEIIRYESEEIDALVERLNFGKISVKSVAADFNLTVNQVRLVLDYLLNINRISGVLTYDETFISNATLRERVIEKAQKNESVDTSELSSQLNITEESVSSIIDSISECILASVSTYNQIRIADLAREVKLPETFTEALLKKIIREGKLAGRLDMVNNVLTIERTQPMGMANQITQKIGAEKPKPSDAWYVVSLFFGLIGGLIGYLVVKEDDPDMATNLLWLGIFISIVEAIILGAYWSWILSLFRF